MRPQERPNHTRTVNKKGRIRKEPNTTKKKKKRPKLACNFQ